MDLELFTYCDAAVEYDGRINMLGATDRFIAPFLPFRHSQCSLVVRLRAATTEEGDHQMRIAVIDAEGKTQLDVTGNLGVKIPMGTPTGALQMIVNMQGLDFNTVGEYTLLLEVDGEEKARQPLYVGVRQD
jgi:hypothetical protein